MKFSPIFESIMAKINSIPESEWDTPQGRRLFQLAHKHAPPEFNELVVREAQAEGKFPKPTHVDADGNPLYCVEELAAFFGQTPDEAQESFQAFLRENPDHADDLHTGPIHRLQ
jgi:hypothetical protein